MYLVSGNTWFGIEGATVCHTYSEAVTLAEAINQQARRGLRPFCEILEDTPENRARFDFIRG